MSLELSEQDTRHLVTLWGRWWDRLIFTDDPGPVGEWPERLAFDEAVRFLGLDVDKTADQISDIYQAAVWVPHEKMYGGRLSR